MFDGYDAEGIVCFACSAREEESRRFNDNEGGAPAGLYITVQKRTELN